MIVRTEVASNTHTPLEVLVSLAADDSVIVKTHAAINPSLAVEDENRLAFGADLDIRLVLAIKSDLTGRSLSLAAQEYLASDSNAGVRAGIARTTDSRSVYERLLVDPVVEVRAGCAQNRRLTEADVAVLAHDRAWSVRMCIAQLPEGPIPNEQVLGELAADRSVNVRWAVAARASTSVELLERLALDPAIDVRDQAQMRLWGLLD